VPDIETVLVVDDEPFVRQFVAKALEHDGFAVLVATGAEDALDVARTHRGRIDLVLTDVCMPRMRGTELVPLLMARRPGLRSVYMSGNTREVPIGQVQPLLEKPFTLAALGAAVRGALAEPRAA
jgi:two-component system, cell cycle sensor histidine kinase and response regulator CckA